jgi:class 3 adenylate cyclase/tetratricopeptide (TPR) repeat protein
MTAKEATAALPQGRRSQATVLFSDLVGYTALTEGVDPEEVAGLLNTILAEAGRIIEAHGGTVNQFAGDEVKAVFGIPAAHDDDPRRAVAAALELHRFVGELDARLGRLLGHRLRLHTGINTGLVVVQRRDSREGVFGLTGDPVNTTARLLAQAGPDEILIGPTTLEGVEPYFAVERVGEIALRGKRRPLVVHRVTGSLARTPFDAARSRGLATYAGREREHARLAQCIAQLEKGRGRFVTVVGQPGLGKSRLFHEFCNQITEANVAVLAGRCEPYGNVSPYQPFVQVLRTLLVARDLVGTPGLVAGIADRLAAVSPDLAPLLPLYLHLLSVSDETHPLPEGLRDERLRHALHDALAALIMRVARGRPTVLLLEDWHWADHASDGALRELARHVNANALLLVVSHRPDTTSPWGTLQPLVLGLQPLDLAETEVVAASRLGVPDLPDELVSFLHQRTGGNPFFIEELCRALGESGAPAPGAVHSFVRDLGESPTPESVQAVVRARIDRLSPSERDLLCRASVLGKRFALPLLESLVEGSPPREAELHRLEDLELLERHVDEAGTTYEFRHVIVQEVAYETLLLQQRRDLHARAARAVEALYAGRLEEQVETLADHYHRSGDLEQAAHWSERAGDKAARVFSLREVRQHYRRAISALDRQEATPERIRRRIDLSVKWGEACVYQPSSEHVAALRESYDQAIGIGHHAGALRSLYWLAWIEHTIGDHRACYDDSQRCLELTAPLGDPVLESRLTFNLGQESYHFTDYDRAATLLAQAISLRRSSGRRGGTTVVASSLGYLALVDVERGDFPLAYRRLDEALGMVRSAGQLQIEGTVTTMLGFAQLFQGDWAASRQTADRLQALNERLDSAAIRAMGLTIEGVARFYDGEPARGIEVLRSAVAEHETSGARMALSVAYAELSVALARTGVPDEAVAVARKALGRCEVGDCPGEVAAHRALALAAAPDWPRMLECAEEAVRLAHAKGSRREEAVSELARAEALRAAGKTAAALAAATRASAEFEAMGMHWYLALARAIPGTGTPG